jgi:hypothetical protein
VVLLVDEYETLNTLPAPKLRRVTFNCSSCSKKNMKSTSRCRGANSTIKEIARHTFLGRMQDYLESFQNESRLVNGIPGQTGSVRTNIPQVRLIHSFTAIILCIHICNLHRNALITFFVCYKDIHSCF